MTDKIVESYEISENIIEVKDRANMTSPWQKQYKCHPSDWEITEPCETS